jgi:putative glutamine amidotransferase
MAIERLYQREQGRLTRRLERMLGSRAAAEDASQEAFLRAWHRAPSELDDAQRAAWLYRTATNLALDELRRRRFAPVDLDELDLAAPQPDGDQTLAAREALEAVTPHERMVLLLRFELGLPHAEIAALLDISAEAARKRVERARGSFAAALRGARTGARPVILLTARQDFDSYRRWLELEGAEVRGFAAGGRPNGELERDLSAADGVVIGGSLTDMHPAAYRERPRAALKDPDLEADRDELRMLRTALGLDLPVVGVCRGHQLLNVALGGNLYQDLRGDGVTRRVHSDGAHPVATAGASIVRGLLGRRPSVASEHHQGTRRLGRGLRATSLSDDGVVESVELPSRRALTLGLQWHPETEASGEAGRRVAAALVEAARR